MSDINTGGSAFPIAGNEYAGHGTYEGMTLRDYFAAKAMAAQIVAVDGVEKNNRHQCDELAVFSYAMADAMLAAKGANHD